MENLFYKGHVGSVEYNEVNKCYFGKILEIDDLVSYEGKTEIELEYSFKEAVDDFLDIKNII